ncbi:tetratricopeptide repeat protein [Candidatus Neomarinimicrobiota bacterium]
MKRQLITAILAGMIFLVNQACETQEFVSAKMYAQQGDLERAEEMFLAALKVETDKNNAEIPYLYASLLAKQEKYIEMSGMLDEAIKRNPNQKVEGYTVRELVENMRKVEWQNAYKRGADLYNAVIAVTMGEEPDEAQHEQMLRAIGHFRTAITIWPEEGQTYQNLVYCYRQLRDKEGERAALDEALAMDPNNSMILFLAAEHALGESDIDQAIIYYQRALEADPTNVNIMQRLTAVYVETGQLQAALEILEVARRQTTSDPDVYFNLGLVYASIADASLEKGQPLFTAAINQDQVSPDDLETALEAFEEAQKAYSEALYFLDNTLALNPDDESAMRAIAEIQNRKKVLDTLQNSAQEILRQQD